MAVLIVIAYYNANSQENKIIYSEDKMLVYNYSNCLKYAEYYDNVIEYIVYPDENTYRRHILSHKIVIIYDIYINMITLLYNDYVYECITDDEINKIIEK